MDFPERGEPVLMRHRVEPVEAEQDEVEDTVPKDVQISGVTDLEPKWNLRVAKLLTTGLDHLRGVIDARVFLEQRAEVSRRPSSPDADVEHPHVGQSVSQRFEDGSLGFLKIPFGAVGFDEFLRVERHPVLVRGPVERYVGSRLNDSFVGLREAFSSASLSRPLRDGSRLARTGFHVPLEPRTDVTSSPLTQSRAEWNPTFRFETQSSGRFRQSRGGEPVMHAMAPHASRLLEASEMVGDELAAHPQGLRNRRGVRALHATQKSQDSEANIAVFPVPRVEPVHLGLATRDVVSGPTVGVLLVDEPLAGECVQMIPSRPNGKIQGSCDRPEVVSREADEGIIDPPADWMLKARHEGHANHDGRRLDWEPCAHPRD